VTGLVVRRVWTRTGGKPHAAREGSNLTLCGREHMGFAGPTSGSVAPRFAPYMEATTCLICVQEAHRV
jgi:hypothetical protein